MTLLPSRLPDSAVRQLAEQAGIDFEPSQHGYPHFFYADERPAGDWGVFELSGEHVRSFLNFALSSDVEDLKPGETQATRLYTAQGEVDGSLTCLDPYRFKLTLPAAKSGVAAAWLRDLSDGFVNFDEDPLRKLPGPVSVANSDQKPAPVAKGSPLGVHKAYFIGAGAQKGKVLPTFTYEEVEKPLRRTPIYETHKKLGARLIPFAGWEMPVWYTSVVEEHLAVRNAAGLFDVAHMGVYQAEGPDAGVFLDSVVGNDIAGLKVGESCYTHLLTPEAEVIDDLLVYRRAAEKYLVVVNASNDDKDWAWLNAVREGKVCVCKERPGARAYGCNVRLRNLRDPQSGADMRVDIALQGPRSRDVLLALGAEVETRKRIMTLKRTELCEAVLGGFDLVVSRTGYTGEKMAFELFVHPGRAEAFFQALLKVGEPFGVKPIGLGSA